MQTADEYKAVTGFPPQIHRGSSTKFNSLYDLVKVGGPYFTILVKNKYQYSLTRKYIHVYNLLLCFQMQLYPETEKCLDRLMFVDLLSMMLNMDPEKRITPSEALIHPFLTLSELGDDDDDDDTICQ